VLLAVESSLLKRKKLTKNMAIEWIVVVEGSFLKNQVDIEEL